MGHWNQLQFVGNSLLYMGIYSFVIPILVSQHPTVAPVLLILYEMARSTILILGTFIKLVVQSVLIAKLVTQSLSNWQLQSYPADLSCYFEDNLIMLNYYYRSVCCLQTSNYNRTIIMYLWLSAYPISKSLLVSSSFLSILSSFISNPTPWVFALSNNLQRQKNQPKQFTILTNIC